MTYAVSILRRAQKELQQLPREDYERVRDAIRTLAHEPRPAGCLALTGRPGQRHFLTSTAVASYQMMRCTWSGQMITVIS